MRKQILLTVLALLGCCTAAWADVEINEANFPDENFRKWVLRQDYGQDGVLTDAEIAKVICINVPFENIRSLKGIEYFTALTTLGCSWSQLTELDVSKNTALTELRCGCNQLTALDVSKNIALTELDCGVNKLTKLDVSQNTALTTLDCSFNQLMELDVSKNTALEKLYCYYNQLTALDVSKNIALTELWCYRNQIMGAAMDALVESLPTVENGKMNVISNEDEGYVMTTAQAAAAKAKGWIPQYTDGSYDELNIIWKEYKGSKR